MQQKNKKCLSWLLVLCMLFTMFPTTATTALAADEQLTAAITNPVAFNDPDVVTELKVSPETARIKVGETVTLTATRLPETATKWTGVSWVSSDVSVAKISWDGTLANCMVCTVTGIKSGAVTVKAIGGENGSVVASCEITVENVNSLDVSTTGLNISNTVGNAEPTEKTVYKAGEGTITFLPATETEPITLVMNNAGIATGISAEDQSGNYNEFNGIVLDGSKTYKLVLVGNNRMTGLYAAITSEDPDERNARASLTIIGGGALTLEDCRTGINGIDQLKLDNAQVSISALEYGITTYGPLKIQNGSEVVVHTTGSSLELDYGGGTVYNFYTNCAVTAYNGDVEITDSKVELYTADHDFNVSGNYVYSWGLRTQNLNDVGKTSIIVDNSSLSIDGYWYGLRDSKDDIFLQNGSTVTIKGGNRTGYYAFGMYLTEGNLQLDDNSQLIITPGTSSYSRGISIATGGIHMNGRSSAEIISTSQVTNTEAINFDAYVQFTNSSGEKAAAYEALVNGAATADGAAAWRHDAENAVSLAAYKYLKITPQSPVVTYVTNCDTELEEQQAVYGASIAQPAKALTKPDYTFGGWYVDEACTQPWDFDKDVVTDNLTLYARWLATDIGVLQVALGETVGIIRDTTISMMLPYGVAKPTTGSAFTIILADERAVCTVPEQSGEKDGSLWNFVVTAENGTTTQAYTIIVSNAAQTGYAITFDVNGGDGENITLRTDEAGRLDALPDAERSGYSLSGWYTAAVGGERVTADTVFTEDITLYAHWSKNSSSGSSSSGGGSSSGSSSGSVTYAVVPDSSNENGTITADVNRAGKGSSVTITVQPDAGYKLGALTVIDQNRNVITLTKQNNQQFVFSMPASKVEIRADFVTIDTACPGTIVCSSYHLEDIDSGQWYHEAVDYVILQGLMSGTDANNFAPQVITTRGMIVTILHRLEGYPEVGTASFTDVAEGQYYTGAIAWAEANRIVSGYGNGKFGPNDAITREQLMAILCNYAAYKGYDRTQGGMAIREYDDYEDISSYALGAMTWAVNSGLLTGTSRTTLSPADNATRAQVAAVLMRFCETTAK